MRIERIAEIRVEQRCIETARPVDPALLGNGKDNLQVAVRQILFLQTAQGLENGSDACLVVRTKDGRAVGADHAVLDDRLDICTWLHTVHVCCEHYGRCACRRPFKICDDIAAVSAEKLSRSILVDLCCAEFLQTCCEEIADFALIKRRAADGDELQELIQDSFLIDHEIPPFRGRAQS